MKRGSVYWISLDAAAPPAVGKLRPGIVVSSSIHNERLDSVVIVPLSSRAPEIWPLRLRVDLRGLKTSYAVIPGVRQVSKLRLRESLGEASGTLMAHIGEALGVYLGE